MSGKILLLLGLSTATADLVETVDRLSSSGRHVLICGERGTGKTVLARYIH